MGGHVFWRIQRSTVLVVTRQRSASSLLVRKREPPLSPCLNSPFVPTPSEPLGLAGRTVTIRDDGPSTISKAAPPHEDLMGRMFPDGNDAEPESLDTF
jgi:hypothetical protein